MKKGKIRDKGTISDCIDHEFAVISLKDQSRVKINMSLKIVHTMKSQILLSDASIVSGRLRKRL